jgi:hypothetical protein
LSGKEHLEWVVLGVPGETICLLPGKSFNVLFMVCIVFFQGFMFVWFKDALREQKVAWKIFFLF